MSTQLVGHGASSAALMTFAYGSCVLVFLDPARTRPPGVNDCGKDGLPRGADVLAETASLVPAKLPAREWWTYFEGVWVGAWSDPALVSVAIESSKNGFEIVYLYGERSGPRLARTTRAPSRLEGRTVVAEMPNHLLLLDFEDTTRQVVMSWRNKENRSGATRLKRWTKPAN